MRGASSYGKKGNVDIFKEAEYNKKRPSKRL